MNSRRVMVPVAAMLLAAACGGDEAGRTEGAAAADTSLVPPPGQTPPMAEEDTTPGKVDTAGVGTEPPTAGGQIVDTAAVPGPTDTVQGTPTAP